MLIIAPANVEIIENVGEPSARITGFITFTIIYTGMNIRIIVKYSFAKPIVTSDAPNKYNHLSMKINPSNTKIILIIKLIKILLPIALCAFLYHFFLELMIKMQLLHLQNTMQKLLK